MYFALPMFYEHRNLMLFKVLGSIIYYIIYKYICLDYLCVNQDKLSSNYKAFQNSAFGDISDIGIPEVLMNIMSFCGFSKEEKTIVILSFCIKLVCLFRSLEVQIPFHYGVVGFQPLAVILSYTLRLQICTCLGPYEDIPSRASHSL